jgi:hypothetical protein
MSCKSITSAYVVGHILQVTRIPLWILACLVKRSLLEKDFTHTSQLKIFDMLEIMQRKNKT